MREKVFKLNQGFYLLGLDTWANSAFFLLNIYNKIYNMRLLRKEQDEWLYIYIHIHIYKHIPVRWITCIRMKNDLYMIKCGD